MIDYKNIFRDRLKTFKKLEDNPKLISAFKKHYAIHPEDYINDWAITFDPRKKGDEARTMPFLLYKRQIELIQWYEYLLQNNFNGVVDKSRDTGCTYVASGYSVAKFLFNSGFKIGFGSRKAALVDTIGDPDSIFEKIRIILRSTPRFFIPKNFDEKRHLLSMRCINPENGSSIMGEGGDEIGRGGRTTMYFKDESAFYERAERIEAALGENTNVQVDISTHNGTNTLFYQATETYPDNQKFIFDWSDIPWKTQEWYDKQKARYEMKGILHLFAQEVDRNPGATLKNVVIPQDWVNAAIDAHLKLNADFSGRKISGLDVADDGDDCNAQINRTGFIVDFCDKWAFKDSDTGITTRKAIQNCNFCGCDNINYDAVGVGSGVKATAGELGRADNLKIRFNPFKGGSQVDNPKEKLIKGQKITNEDTFLNLKSQYWWRVRVAFENTYKAINGMSYDKSNIISISSKISHLSQLKRELSQAQYIAKDNGKIMIKKKGEGKKSPNIADALIISWRVPKSIAPLLIAGNREDPRNIYR